ncbi:MAG: FtsL-like putative cell division protein [Bacteroidales bacterium]|jgi:hypothetical protein|nr:FtsL-like putative cell division protein [Bacteroidales bacterium]
MNSNKKDISPNEEPKKARKNFVNAYVKPLLDGSLLSSENSAKELPFMAFLLLLIILFISNTFWAQSTARKINKYKQEVKELRIKSISVKSKLMDNTRQNQIADKVKSLGLKESLKPPKKIYVAKELNK